MYLSYLIHTSPSSASSSQPSSYTYYDPHDPHSHSHSQNHYSSYPSRTPPAVADTQVDHRKLPPLATPSNYDRWSPSYAPNQPAASHIRSPTATYSTNYAPYTASSPNYSYNIPATQSVLPPTNSSLASAMNQRSGSPYPPGHSHGPSSYSPPPVSPTSSEEPTIKKKRKRADAAQLKILTETYNRTAFPSTEERLELAKALDMTPRSVQIWYLYPRHLCIQATDAFFSGSRIGDSRCVKRGNRLLLQAPSKLSPCRPTQMP